MAARSLKQRADVGRQPFLAADVGGTHARVALLRAGRPGTRELDVVAYRKFACADYASLSELLHAFIAEDATLPVRRCVLACAGQVLDDGIINDNLPWRVRLSGLRADLAFDEVEVLNDFEALGYALQDMDVADTVLVCGPDAQAAGPALVVGPGTGLGAAVCLPGAGVPQVLATEAGQMDFGPVTAREREVLARLAPSDGYVPYERILSGPGLKTLYATLCHLRGGAPLLASPEAITAAACRVTDADAVETVDIFCAVLGGFVGNLALAYMAEGGVYLAGGVLPEMRGLLLRSRFAQRFLNKGGMRTFLRRVPVRLIEHGRHGVYGAAHWYLDHQRDGPPRGRAVNEGMRA